MKHYMDIQAFKTKFVEMCNVGDYLVVQEKIDGANFSIRCESDRTVKCFSRKQELTPTNTLRGAFGFTQTLDANKLFEVLGDTYILFGEWLVPHSVKYPEDKYHRAYFYDVYDSKNEKWLPQDKVEQMINELSLTYVPVFFKGVFTDWDSLISLIGKTQMGGEYGEGIVIKNMTRLNDPNNRLPFYTKMVGEKFKETKGHREAKIVDPEKLKEMEYQKAVAETIVTEARVTKILYKMIDEGIIPADWDQKHMSIIAKNINKLVYNDCVKEEKETVSEVGDTFGKLCSKITMDIVRKKLSQ